MTYFLLFLFWSIRWTVRIVGWPIVVIAALSIPVSHFAGFFVSLMTFFFMEEIVDFCDDIRVAIRAGGVKTPLEAANFELDHYVPLWNGPTAPVLPPGEDTMQRDLFYPDVRRRDTNRMLAKEHCPNCNVFRWGPEAEPVPVVPSLCRWCNTEMTPVHEHQNGKPRVKYTTNYRVPGINAPLN